MKIILRTCLYSLISLASLTSAHSQSCENYEAKPIGDLITQIKNASFKYIGRGVIFGFNSIHSCVFVSENVIVMQNYCFPRRDYPVRGLTVISKKFGVIEFYQEDMGFDLRREIGIDDFPEELGKFIDFEFHEATLVKINSLLEKLYNQFGPGCWSSNYLRSSDGPGADCSIPNVMGKEIWFRETQVLTNSGIEWDNLLNNIRAKLIFPDADIRVGKNTLKDLR